jgi:cobalt-zinc-cadmium efflux system outer membrane protein
LPSSRSRAPRRSSSPRSPSDAASPWRRSSARAAAALVAALVAALAALVAGCAPTPTALRRPVNVELARRGLPEVGVVSPHQARAVEAAQALLARPLTLDAALRIALANNRRLQADAEELGVARADLIAAALPPVQVSATYHLGDYEIDALADVLGLFDLAARRRAAHAEIERVTASVVGSAVRLAAEVEVAYGAMAAEQAKVALRRHHFDAAAAAALVRQRAFDAGGGTELELARQLDQRETARSLLARAEVELALARERLGRALGVSGADASWTLADAPPTLPPQPPALDALEGEAVAASTELTMARAGARARAEELGAARLRRWLPRVGVGAVAEYVEDEWSYGPAVSLSLPLTGGDTAAARRGESRLRKAQHELYAQAVELRSAARAARLAALGAYAEAAQLRDVVVPLRQRILDETVRHYNAMNADTIALLLAQQALVEGQHMLIAATARYAAAMAEVSALRRGVSASAGAAPGAAAAAGAASSSSPEEPPSAHGLH